MRMRNRRGNPDCVIACVIWNSNRTVATLYLLMPEITVELLEAEQTLVEIFTVQLWVKV